MRENHATAWGDFHARSRFAYSTIPEGKWGLLVVYVFLGVAKSIVGKLLCFGVGIVECLFNLLKYPFSPQRDFI